MLFRCNGLVGPIYVSTLVIVLAEPLMNLFWNWTKPLLNIFWNNGLYCLRWWSYQLLHSFILLIYFICSVSSLLHTIVGVERSRILLQCVLNVWQNKILQHAACTFWSLFLVSSRARRLDRDIPWNISTLGPVHRRGWHSPFSSSLWVVWFFTHCYQCKRAK